MEVIVKNCPISKTHVSKMSYNSHHKILACNIDANDTILFFTLDNQTMTFHEIFKGMSKPPGSKISMTWSPDGNYLALGSGNIEIWQLKDTKLKPIKSYQEDFVQIKLIEWSVDSQSYACGGISKTNTIRIRNIQTNKTKDLQLPQNQTVAAISFDPYGKYLFLLLRNNSIEIYSVVNFQRQKSVRLSPQGLRINPIKETRTTSWSPEFNYFVCPSLDDSRINFAVNLSRNRDFKSRNIFLGHCTSISCCKFSPKLYRWNGQVTSILAMGDSAGNVSIWRIGSKNEYNEPLLLSNSLQNSLQVVEDIEWDQTGQILMINMMKKYIHLIRFIDKEKDFGVELSTSEVIEIIQQTYGSYRATDVNKKQIQIFDINNSRWNSIQQQKKIDYLIENNIQTQHPSNHIQIEQMQLQNHHNFQQKQLKEVSNNNYNNQPSRVISSQNQMEIQKKQIVNQNQILNGMNPEEKYFDQNNINQQQSIIKTKSSQIKLLQANYFQHTILETKPIPQEIKPFIPQTKPFENLPNSSQNQYVKLYEQKTIMGKNNKKKIQPALMVRKEEITALNIKQSLGSHYGVSNNNLYFTNSMVQTLPNLELPHINFVQKQILLPNHKIIQIKKISKATFLQIFNMLQENTIVAKRIFPLSVEYIEISGKFIYVINQQYLYIFDFDLHPLELPIKVGHIHKFLTNQNGIIYFINCDGYLIGFDHLNHINKTLTPVPIHMLLKRNLQNQVFNDPSLFFIQDLSFSTDSDLFITVINERGTKNQKRERFLYDNKINGWVKLQFKQGLFQPGFSIKITDSQQNLIKNFFRSLCPSLGQKQEGKNINEIQSINPHLVLSPHEESMIFYSKYHRDEQKYENSLINYLKQLKNHNKNSQLRRFILQHCFDSKSSKFVQEQLKREKLWEKIKGQIGGKVTQEFTLSIQDNQRIQLE